jgi:hypothetical protein
MKHVLKHVHNGASILNNSKLFAGILMILMNIGSKYITVRLSDSQEAYLRNNVAREVIIFAVCWMGTRDILLATILTSSFFVLTQHLFNETSPLCILPEKHRHYHKGVPAEGVVSDADLKAAMNTVKLAHEQKAASDADKLYTYFSDARI